MGTYVVELVVAVNGVTGSYVQAAVGVSGSPTFSNASADLVNGANAQAYNGATGPFNSVQPLGTIDFVGGGSPAHAASLDFDYSLIVPIIRLDGVGSLVSFAGLPAGFTPTSAELHATLLNNAFTGFFVKWHLGANVSAATDTYSSGDQQVYSYAVVPSMLDLLNNGCGLEYAYAPTGSASISFYKLRIQGNYTIVSTAWAIPDPATSPDGTGEAGTGAPSALNANTVRNACGVPTDSHVVIATSSPGAGYVSLSPAPTPVIDSITPPSGTTNGGQAVTIRGAAFSDDATVTFDGDDATSVVVVSQFEITCVTPAHVAGSTDVVVTNGDGSHS